MEKLILTFKDIVHLVNQKEIIYCKSENSYTSIYLVNDKKLIASKSLTKIFNELNSEKFVKVSQSYLINIDYLNQINRRKKFIVLTDSINIPFTIKVKELLAYFTMETPDDQILNVMKVVNI